MANLREQLTRVTRYSDNYYASYKFNSIGPERSFLTDNPKKANFPETKDLGLLFSPIIEHEFLE